MIDSQSMEETPPTVSSRTLRQFAALCLGVPAVFFLLSWYRHAGMPTPVAWLARVVAGLFGTCGLIKPGLIRPMFIGSMAATRPVGHVAGMVVLAIIYYGFVTPLALVFRWRGRDTLVRRRPDAVTYWVRKRPPGDVSRYLRQYQRQ